MSDLSTLGSVHDGGNTGGGGGSLHRNGDSVTNIEVDTREGISLRRNG